ncbi:hypothetical protein [Nocardia nova]|uniref:hypothetical protein n=1 Tax=Nocardia nova TaxID=37330 RepID=UPI0033F78299
MITTTAATTTGTHHSGVKTLAAKALTDAVTSTGSTSRSGNRWKSQYSVERNSGAFRGVSEVPDPPLSGGVPFSPRAVEFMRT